MTSVDRKEAHAAASRRYYEKHRAEVADAKKRQREEDPERFREYARRAYEKTRQDPAQVERARLKAERARLSNPEYIAKYRRLHPNVGARASQERRARRHGALRIPYTVAEVLSTWGTKCHVCDEEVDLTAPRAIGRPGWQRGLHLDHVVPLKRGGDDVLDNVRPAHGLCNLRKAAR